VAPRDANKVQPFVRATTVRVDHDFVTWFRSVAPYVNSFRNKTFVVAFGGEVVADGKYVVLVHHLN